MPRERQLLSNGSGYGWIIAASFSFSMMSIFTRYVSRSVSWELIALIRIGFCLGIVLAIAIIRRIPLVCFSSLPLCFRSVIGGLSLLYTIYGLSVAPVSEVTAIQNLQPLWMVLLAWIFLHEFVGWRTLVRLMVSLGGVVILLKPGPTGIGGTAAALVSSLLLAAAMLAMHRIRAIDPIAIVVHFSAVSLIMATVYFGTTDALGSLAFPQASEDWAMLLAVGAFGAAGQYCMTCAYLKGSPVQVAVVGLAQVAMGFIADVYLFEYFPTPTRSLGLFLVVASTASLLCCDPPPSKTGIQ